MDPHKMANGNPRIDPLTTSPSPAAPAAPPASGAVIGNRVIAVLGALVTVAESLTAAGMVPAGAVPFVHLGTVIGLALLGVLSPGWRSRAGVALVLALGVLGLGLVPPGGVAQAQPVPTDGGVNTVYRGPLSSPPAFARVAVLPQQAFLPPCNQSVLGMLNFDARTDGGSIGVCATYFQGEDAGHKDAGGAGDAGAADAGRTAYAWTYPGASSAAGPAFNAGIATYSGTLLANSCDQTAAITFGGAPIAVVSCSRTVYTSSTLSEPFVTAAHTARISVCNPTAAPIVVTADLWKC